MARPLRASAVSLNKSLKYSTRPDRSDGSALRGDEEATVRPSRQARADEPPMDPTNRFSPRDRVDLTHRRRNSPRVKARPLVESIVSSRASCSGQASSGWFATSAVCPMNRECWPFVAGAGLVSFCMESDTARGVRSRVRWVSSALHRCRRAKRYRRCICINGLPVFSVSTVALLLRVRRGGSGRKVSVTLNLGRASRGWRPFPRQLAHRHRPCHASTSVEVRPLWRRRGNRRQLYTIPGDRGRLRPPQSTCASSVCKPCGPDPLAVAREHAYHGVCSRVGSGSFIPALGRSSATGQSRRRLKPTLGGITIIRGRSLPRRLLKGSKRGLTIGYVNAPPSCLAELCPRIA